MNRDIFKILQILKDEIASHVLLSKSERARIFETIDRAAQNQTKGQYAHIAGEVASTVSPYAGYVKPRPLGSHIFFMNYASITLAVFLVVAGSVSFAAEQSLPGDTLYVVKTNFNEDIRSALTFSAESKAKLEASFAEERLVEAQKLAISNELTPTVQAEITENFKKHTEEFAKNVKEVKEKDNPAIAVTISRNFQSKLRAHEKVMNTIAAANQNESGNSSEDNLSTILAMKTGTEDVVTTTNPEQGSSQGVGEGTGGEDNSQVASTPVEDNTVSLMSVVADDTVTSKTEDSGATVAKTSADAPKEIDNIGVEFAKIASPTGDSSSKSVTNTISEEINTLETLRIESQDLLRTMSHEQVKKAAEDVALEAEVAIKKLENSLDKTSYASSSIGFDIEAYIINAHAELETGYKLIEKENFIDAYIAFQDALLRIQEADQTVTGTQKLQLDDATKETVLKSVVSKDDGLISSFLKKVNSTNTNSSSTKVNNVQPKQ